MPNTLTMNPLVLQVVAKTNLSDSQVRAALKALVDTMQDHLSTAGNKVTVTGLGTFRSTQKGDRTARNPRTGEESYVDPYLKCGFRPSDLMSDVMNGRR